MRRTYEVSPAAFWDDMAAKKGLQPVIDSNDTAGHKNSYLDYLTRLALDRVGRFNPQDVVLDYGCGFGRVSVWLAGKVSHVSGTDISAAMIQRARSESAHLTNVEFEHLNPTTQTLPFADGTFSKVVSVWVIQHIVDDLELQAMLRELARTCVDGGTLIFLERVSQRPAEDGMPAGYINRRQPQTYKNLFEAAGLSCESMDTVRISPLIMGSRLVNSLVVRGLLPRLLYKPLAHIDLAIQRRRQSRQDWADVVFVCRKA